MTIPPLDVYELPRPAELPKPRLDWEFDPNRAALLVHDMQRYFLDFYAEEFRGLIGNIARLREAGTPVLYTAQPPKQDPATRGLLSDRWGPGLQDRDEIVPGLEPRPSDVVLTKHRYSAFHRSDLLERLRAAGRDQLVVTGVFAHIGITATALDAFGNDLRTFVVADAIADFDRPRHLATLEHLAATCAVVTMTDNLVGAESAELDLAAVRAQVLALLDEPADDDENLIDAGLDSIRVMGLIEDWRDRGHAVTFADLAAEPTIRGFHAALEGAR